MWGTQPELTAEINRLFRQRHPMNTDADFYPQILVRVSACKMSTILQSRCRAETREHTAEVNMFWPALL